MMKYFRHWVEYLAVRFSFCLLQILRIETCQSLSSYIGWLAADVIGFRREVIDENLCTAFPQSTPRRRREIARAMWQHLFLLICEIAHVPRKIHLTNFRDYIRFHGEHHRGFIRYLLDVRPLTMVSGHFGNFELGGYAIGLFGFRTFAVARPLDNPYLDQFFNRFRAKHGQTILPTRGSAKQVAAILEKGHTLALLCDQWAGRKGCWVEFFGKSTSCHKAIAVFPLSNQAPLVVAYAKRVDRPLQFELGTAALADPLIGGDQFASVRSLTQWYNWRLEDIIRESPEQYWWLHRRWKGCSPRRRRPAAA